MRSSTGRLPAVDEANLVLDHAGQVNVFLIVGLVAPGGFVGLGGGHDVAALRAGIKERVAAIPSLHRAQSRSVAGIAGAKPPLTSTTTSGPSTPSTDSRVWSDSAGN